MNINKTAAEWELYSHHNSPQMRRALAEATKALNAALELAVAAVQNGMSLSDAMEDFMYPVMDMHASTGASDSEPRNHALDTLEAAQKMKAV